MEGNHLAKNETIQIIREVLQRAGIPTTRAGHDHQEVQRFHGHSLRVSDAQYMTVLGFDTTVVMLLKRWGSQLILRYVQDESHPRDEGPPAVINVDREDQLSQLAVKKLRAEHAAMQTSTKNLAEQYSNRVHQPNPKIRGRPEVPLPDPVRLGDQMRLALWQPHVSLQEMLQHPGRQLSARKTSLNLTTRRWSPALQTANDIALSNKLEGGLLQPCTH